LWCVGVIGTLWADVSWSERFLGLGSFHRLLVIPLLFAQFRRSEHGKYVIYGFLLSSALVLIASYVLVLNPQLIPPQKAVGVPAHDDIFQGTLCVICGFGALGCAARQAANRYWGSALAYTAVAATFLANFLFVPEFSRSAIVVAAALTALFGWRFFRWKGLLAASGLAIAVSAIVWSTSLSFRERVYNSVDELRGYTARNEATSIGQHLAFLNESLTIISSAPLLGHGTGSIAKEFRQITSEASGASGVATVNPHNQTFAVAIQIGLLGAIVLWAMWIAHFRLFREEGILAWMGTMIVVENIVSSFVHSHLFDSAHGWLYVFGVGVLGGMALRQRAKVIEIDLIR
jgi:O-antigen ligase